MEKFTPVLTYDKDFKSFIYIGPSKAEKLDLKAAAAFRQYSDESAKKVFDRTLLTHYKSPRLPQLPFLDPHQVDGVKWILSRSRCYLAHAPGAGKTAQAIVAGLLSQSSKIVFIVPPSLVANWVREIYKFCDMMKCFPTIGVVPLSAEQDSMDWEAQFIVCPDSLLTRPWVSRRLARLQDHFLAVDEASRLKEPTAERSLAFYGGRLKGTFYSGIFRRAKHVVFLDGSPMPNRPMELWAPLYALAPQAIDFMTQHEFGLKFCGAKIGQWGWEYSYSSNEEELSQRLMKDFMHLVPESALSHPERRRSILFMDQDVRSPEHKTWERLHLHKVELREGLGQGDLATYRRELGLKKVPWIAEYVRDRLQNKKESILLFVWHREVAERLREALKKFNPGLVIGGTDDDYRERLFKQFQEGKCKLIIGNIGAMGRGHNLQKADRVIFGEFSWTDELNKQCEKRASRRGNAKAFVRCEYVVAPHSMDEKVMSSVFTKVKRVEEIIG